MIEIVKQVIKYYLENNKSPSLQEIQINDKSLLEISWTFFVTILKSGQIRWSAWYVHPQSNSALKDLISVSVQAISSDSRFSPLSQDEFEDINIRVDYIDGSSREFLSDENDNKKIEKLNPVNSWLLVIKKDHKKLAVILPNINPKLSTWKDLYPILSNKLWEVFKQEDYLIYKLNTKQYTDY